jgi:hypothetical protein
MAIKAAATARTAMARDTADAIIGHRADVVASLGLILNSVGRSLSFLFLSFTFTISKVRKYCFY